MKILGIGVDIIENNRIKKSIQNNKFKTRVYSSNELKLSKNVKLSLGSRIKKPTNSEKKNIELVRKKIFSSKIIKKGEIFSSENLITLRSPKGISAELWKSYIGRKSKRNYLKNEEIKD